MVSAFVWSSFEGYKSHKTRADTRQTTKVIKHLSYVAPISLHVIFCLCYRDLYSDAYILVISYCQ